jgi:hypothetical protein
MIKIHCQWHKNYCGHACEECVEELESAYQILEHALKKILDPKHLRNTSFLASYPPQNAAVWDIQSTVRQALEKK